jgi:hypothetical protein
VHVLIGVEEAELDGVLLPWFQSDYSLAYQKAKANAAKTTSVTD